MQLRQLEAKMFDKIDPGGETGSLSDESQDMPTKKQF